MFYSIIFSDFEQNTKKLGVVNEIVTVYVPDLAAILGKKRNLSKLKYLYTRVGGVFIWICTNSYKTKPAGTV